MATLLANETNCPTQHFDLEAGINTNNAQNMGLASKTLTASESITLPNVIQTDRPLKIRIGLALASGGLHVKASVHNGTPNFTSPDASAHLTDTDGKFIEVVTTANNPLVSVQLVDDGAGSVVDHGFVEVKGLFKVGEGYHEARYAFNGINPANGGDYSTVLVS